MTKTCVKSKYLHINYGLNKRDRTVRRGKKYLHSYGKMRIKGVWGSEETFDKIKRIIFRRHPGWNITGWCLLRKPKKS